MCQIFVIHLSFQSSETLELDSRVDVILFNLNFLGKEKLGLFSQRTYDFQNFENEALFMADHEDAKKSAFDWLAAKLKLKESTILWKVCTFE